MSVSVRCRSNTSRRFGAKMTASRWCLPTNYNQRAPTFLRGRLFYGLLLRKMSKITVILLNKTMF